MKSFISRLCEVEGEAAETQVWVEFAVKCGYMERDIGAALYQCYHEILATLVGMITHPQSWVLPQKKD